MIGCVLAGGITGTRTLTETESGVGESQRADQRIEAAGLRDFAVESVLVRSGDANATQAAADALVKRLRGVHISSIFGKLDLPASDDGHRRVLAVLAFLRSA